MKLDIQRFADGKIIIETEVDNSGLKKGVNEAKKSVSSTGTTIKGIIAGLGITKLISTAISTINSNIDGALKRFDTLNNFPKVMNNLGISSGEASKSVNTLSDKLTGLPTTLDQATSAVQRLTSANGDINKSTEIFLAMNNAILAGGASMETQATAMEQLSQAYAKGKPDAMEWRSILTAMPAQLKQMAIELGYASTAVGGDFYEAIQSGNLSMDEFMNTMIKLNNEGTKGFASFTEQAKSATGGVQTATANMKTSITRAITSVIEELDKGLKNFGGLSGVISNIGKKAEKVIKSVAKSLPAIITIITNLFNIIKKLEPVILAVGVAFASWKIGSVVQSAAQAIQGFQITLSLMKLEMASAGGVAGVLKMAIASLNAVFMANPVSLIITAIVALVATFAILWNKCEAFREFWINLWEDIKNFFSNTWEAIGRFFTETIPEWINGAIDWFKNLPYNIGYALGEFLGKIIQLGVDMWNWVKNDLPKIIQGIIDWFKSLPSKIWEWLKQIPGKVKDMATNLINTARAEIPKFINTFVNFMKQLPAKMVEIGANIVKGIWTGIQNTAKWFKDKVKEFADGIVDGIKDALSIKSPSRVMRDEVGKYISQGIGVGMIDELDDVYKDMQNAIDFETSKMTANVQSSGTYQMAMAGTPTFNLLDSTTNKTQLVVNGKVLAEAVNTENRNREVARA